MNLINSISKGIDSLSLVGKATLDNSDPTPGYVLVDLQNESFKSNEKSQEILQQLLYRLKKDSVFIKLKSLKCLKYLMLKGNPLIKQELSTFSNEISLYANYRGSYQANDHTSDIPYLSIRKEAGEILAIIFQFSSEPKNQNKQLAIIGSNNVAGGNNSIVLYNEGIEGRKISTLGVGSNGAITNAPIAPPTKMKEIKEKLTMLPSKIASLTQDKKASYSDYPMDDHSNQNINNIRDGSHLMYSQNDFSNSGGPEEDDESYNTPSIVRSTIGSSKDIKLSTNSISTFLNHYSASDRDQKISILFSLNDKLNSSKQWQIKHRCLVLIEKLLQIEDNQNGLIDDENNDNVTYSYFVKNSNNLIQLTNSMHLVSREKSQIILNLLGIKIEPQKSETIDDSPQVVENQTNQNNISSPYSDMFNFDEPTPIIQPTNQKNNNQLFGGLSINKSVKNNESLIDFDFNEIPKKATNNNINTNTNNTNSNNNSNNSNSNDLNNFLNIKSSSSIIDEIDLSSISFNSIDNENILQPKPCNTAVSIKPSNQFEKSFSVDFQATAPKQESPPIVKQQPSSPIIKQSTTSKYQPNYNINLYDFETTPPPKETKPTSTQPNKKKEEPVDPFNNLTNQYISKISNK